MTRTTGYATGDQEADHTLVGRNDGAYKRALQPNKQTQLCAAHNSPNTHHHHRNDAVATMLSPLNDRRAKGRFLLRNTLSLADRAIAPFMRPLAAVDPPGLTACRSYCCALGCSSAPACTALPR